jgi:hypothetical protein
MPHLRIWQAGNSLVLTITKRLAREYSLQAGSIVSIERMKHTTEGFRVIPPIPDPPKQPARLTPKARRTLSRGLKHPTARR